MKERGMIFNTEMVQAILDGKKTQTRRPVKGFDLKYVQADSYGGYFKTVRGLFGGEKQEWVEGKTHSSYEYIKDGCDPSPMRKSLKEWVKFIDCPSGKVGDRLWVRETCCIAPKDWADPDGSYIKDYDGDLRYVTYKSGCKSEEGMRDYGLKWTPSIHMPRWASRITLEITNVRVERLQDISEEDAKAEGFEYSSGKGSLHHFFHTWDGIYNNFDENPWVWVVEFKVLEVKS